MKFSSNSVFFIELTIVLLCASLNDAQETDYIVGGISAKPGEVPYQISLQYNEQHICGGSILTRCLILTAAHCVAFPQSSLSILAGTTQLNSGGVRATIARIIPHEFYNASINNILNDIALIKLKTCLPNNNNNIKAVKLLRTPIGGGDLGIVSGWGFIDQNGTIKTNNLQKLTVTTITNQQCSTALGANLPNGTICTLDGVGEGFCQGDSGGPLVDLKSNAQMGLVSANIPCARGYPDVYTRISSYIFWILWNAIRI